MRIKHKNQIFKYLSSTRWGIDRFDIAESESVVLIRFLGTPFVFRLTKNQSDQSAYIVSCTKYTPSLQEICETNVPREIELVLFDLRQWLFSEVKAYLDDQTETDLWDEYMRGKEYLKLDEIDFDDHSAFSPDDKVQIAFVIQNLKLTIPQQFAVSAEQLLIINKRLDYLVEVANRVSKTDWKGILIGVVFSIIIALSLDTEKGRELWNLFIRALGSIKLIHSPSLG